MRYLGFLLLGLLTPTALVVGPALAPADAITTLVRAGSGEVAPGATITVPVTAENVPADSPLAAATIEILYDPSVLDATSCDIDPNAMFDSAACNPDFDNNGIDPDTVRFNVTSVSGVSGDPLLANITFAAVGQSGDTTVVAVVIAVFADPAGDPVAASGQDGQICLTPCATPTPCPDSDGDDWCDSQDNCPAVSTPWFVPEGDGDCDGFTDAGEVFAGTDPADACPDDPGDDAWPADLAALAGYGIHDGVTNIFDINELTPPYFNKCDPDPLYTVRKDFSGLTEYVPDGCINIFDITLLTPPMFGKSCTP
jgi:hypothetical protein